MEFRRYNKLVIGLGIAVAILIGRLVQIQILDDSYKIDAENNSMVYDYIYPTRGIIYDRNGEILVGNKVSYDITVRPREIKQLDTLLLSEALDTSVEFIRDKMSYYRKWRSRIGYKSVPFMTRVSPEQYMKFSEVAFEFPEFDADIRSVRQYPINAGGNLLGYVSEVDANYIKKHPEYRPGDYAGNTGIEAAREENLRGEKGYHIYLRDSRNKVMELYREGEADKPAVPGQNIKTTIDAHLQQYGQALMANKVGSLIAIEPATGEILAMVSSPCLDVEKLADIGKHYKEIANNPYKPMFNRTVQASYPPGSVFKLVNCLIGLQEGVLEPWMQYPCHEGYYYSKKHKLGCHPHRTPLNMTDAIMSSCNSYFCYVMKSVLENKKYKNTNEAFDKWNAYVHSFGFGQKLGSDFPNELGGNIPTSKYYDKIHRKKWGFTNIVSLSIGQGEIGATPLQIANLCATVANRGYYIIPHIIKDSEDLKIDDKYREKHYTMVDTTKFQLVIEGMYKAVNAGYGSGATAPGAAVPGLEICGKTGTAQNPHGDDNSVFMCFAPRENPRIAVVAYIENAGFGAAWASPIASLLVEKYLNGSISPERQYMEDRVMRGNLLHKVKIRK